jgi:hypothetical protein
LIRHPRLFSPQGKSQPEIRCRAERNLEALLIGGVSGQVISGAHTLTMTARLLTPFLIVIPAILFGLYQVELKPLFEVGGVWKEVQDVGGELKETCTYVDDLKGCERKRIF